MNSSAARPKAPVVDRSGSPAAEALRLCRAHIRSVLLFSACINVAYLAPTLYMLQVYDRVLPSGSTPTLLFLTFALMGALAFLALLDQLRQRIMLAASVRLDRVFSARIFRRLSDVVSGDRSSRVSQAVREFDTLRAAVTGPAAMAAFDVPWIPVYLAVCFALHVGLGLLAIGAAALLVVLAVANDHAGRGWAAESSKAAAQTAALQDAVSNAPGVIRSLGMGDAMVVQFMAGRSEVNRPLLEAQHAQTRIGGLSRFFRLFMQSAALGLGVWLAINRQLSPGAIFAASMLVSRALAPIDQLVAGYRSIAAAPQAYASLRALLTASEAAERTALPPPDPVLSVRGLGVLEDGRRRYQLQDVTFEARGGSVIGIVGPSGSGKSALLRILANARSPDTGEVRLGGAKLSDWAPEALGRHIGYLSQEPVLFPGSVKDNISRFERLTGTPVGEVDAAVVLAARRACVHELILSLPAGYDTVLGPRGQGLGASQKQRIALARALYGKPRYYVLDEPNSALDGPAEIQLMQTISRLRQEGSLVILSAHRMPLIGLADQIAVMKNGRMEQFGPSAIVLERLRAAVSESRPPVLKPTPLPASVEPTERS